MLVHLVTVRQVALLDQRARRGAALVPGGHLVEVTAVRVEVERDHVVGARALEDLAQHAHQQRAAGVVGENAGHVELVLRHPNPVHQFGPFLVARAGAHVEAHAPKPCAPSCDPDTRVVDTDLLLERRRRGGHRSRHRITHWSHRHLLHRRVARSGLHRDALGEGCGHWGAALELCGGNLALRRELAVLSLLAELRGVRDLRSGRGGSLGLRVQAGRHRHRCRGRRRGWRHGALLFGISLRDCRLFDRRAVVISGCNRRHRDVRHHRGGSSVLNVIDTGEVRLRPVRGRRRGSGLGLRGAVGPHYRHGIRDGSRGGAHTLRSGGHLRSATSLVLLCKRQMNVRSTVAHQMNLSSRSNR